MTEGWIEEYRAAYAAANGRDAPQVMPLKGGWYRLSDGFTKFRRRQLEGFTVELRQRAEGKGWRADLSARL